MAIAPNGRDGSEITVNCFKASVHLAGLGDLPVVLLALGNEARVGRGASDRFLVTLDRGRAVGIEP